MFLVRTAVRVEESRTVLAAVIMLERGSRCFRGRGLETREYGTEVA